MSRAVQWTSEATAALKKLPVKQSEQIVRRGAALGDNPYPSGCKKLQGQRGGALYRIRSGNYRILYLVRAEMVIVIDVGDRKEVYRKR